MEMDFANSFLESFLDSRFLDELFLDSRLELAILQSRPRVSTISRQSWSVLSRKVSILINYTSGFTADEEALASTELIIGCKGEVFGVGSSD